MEFLLKMDMEKLFGHTSKVKQGQGDAGFWQTHGYAAQGDGLEWFGPGNN